MANRRSAGVGVGLALLSAAAFGTSGTFARSLIDAGWTPQAAIVARVGIASLVLAVPTAIAVRGRWQVLRRNVGIVGLFGLLAVAGGQVCYFNALRYLPVGVALLLEYLGIILVVLWMWAAHGQRPRRLTVAGSAAALTGLLFVLDPTDAGGFEPAGVLWGLGAAIGLATYFVLSARVDPQLPSVAMASGGMAVGCAVLVLLGAVGAAPMHATFGTVTFSGHRTSWLVPVIGLSLIAAAVSHVAGIGAARILGARLSSFVGLTEVLFGVLVAAAVLGEVPTTIQLLGAAMIVAGVTLVRVDELRPVRSREPAGATGSHPPAKHGERQLIGIS